MRLWHYKLIPYLPDSQLVAQWRELNAIYKNQPNHILINYVYQHGKDRLLQYSDKVCAEMRMRCFNINYCNYNVYFFDVISPKREIPYPEHDDRYMLQCFCNLQEKYDRGQKDFTARVYKKLEEFVCHELPHQIGG